jgi:hypothetical protein
MNWLTHFFVPFAGGHHLLHNEAVLLVQVVEL